MRMKPNPAEEMMIEPTRSVTGGWGMLQAISVTQGNFHLATVSDWGRVISTCTSPSLGRWPEDLRLSLEADSDTLAWLELMLSGRDMRSRYTVRFQLEGSAEFREGMVMWIMPLWSSAGG